MPSFPISFSITVNGVQKHPKASTVHIHRVMNGRASAAFTLLSDDRSYRPPLDATVTIAANGTTIFGGVIERPQEAGYFNGSHPGILTPINAVDYFTYVERRIALTTIPAGTMKAAFEQLRSEYLDEFGVTLDGSQVDGPDLPFIEFGGWKLHDAFNHLLTLAANAGGSPATPYTYRIDENKVLSVFQPSTEAAPFDLVGDDLPEVVGDIEVETSRDSTYANKIIGRIVATATTPDIYVYAEDFDQSDVYGTWDKYLVFHDVPTEAVGQARVNAELAKSAHIKQLVRYHTFEDGLFPGMSQTITVPSRDVDATGVITEINTRDYGKDRLIHQVTVTVDDSGTNLERGWGDVFKLWARDTQGGGDAGQVEATIFAPADPVRSVQFNDSGVFGGDAAFIYYKDQNSIVCGGGGSSITAGNFESCQVFGYNNHIADP